MTTTITWGDPVRPDKEARTSFPTREGLPTVLADFVETRARELHVGEAMVALPAMGTATAACGAAWIHSALGWDEPGPLWFMNCAEPGSRKSAALSSALKPLLEAERELREADSTTRRVKEAKIAHAEAKAKAAAADLMKIYDDPDAGKEEIAKAESDLELYHDEMMQTIARMGCEPKLAIGSYATAEALHDLLAKHKHLLMQVAEGDSLFRKLGPKSDLDRDIFLQGWSMESHARNLRTASVQDAIDPSLCLMVVVQTSVVVDVVREARALSDTGFFDRFLCAVIPDDKLQEVEIKSIDDLDAFLNRADNTPETARYHAAIKREVHRTLPLSGEPTQWYLDADAAEIDQNFFDDFARKKLRYSTTSKGALSKLAGNARRLARVFAQLEMCDNPRNPLANVIGGAVPVMDPGFAYRIDAANMRRGWIVAWWALHEHEYLFGYGASDEVRDIRMLTEVIKKCLEWSDGGTEQFTARWAMRNGLGYKKDTLEPALKNAVAGGWLDEQKRGNTTVYTIHPDISAWVDKYAL